MVPAMQHNCNQGRQEGTGCDGIKSANALAAPATVSGEVCSKEPLVMIDREGKSRTIDP